MHQFKEFNIKTELKPFSGDKIKIDKILNKEIIVQDYKIEKSKYDKGNGQRLCLQIELDNVQRIVFTGSIILQDLIKKIPKDKFPFQTTIVKENESFQFT